MQGIIDHDEKRRKDHDKFRPWAKVNREINEHSPPINIYHSALQVQQ